MQSHDRAGGGTLGQPSGHRLEDLGRELPIEPVAGGDGDELARGTKREVLRPSPGFADPFVKEPLACGLVGRTVTHPEAL
jgi:hypothetical protein